MILKQITVVAVPVVAVLVFGSIFWEDGGIRNSDHLCTLTDKNTEGPYYIAGSPSKEILGAFMDGERLIISGQVLDYDCNPVPGAIIDIWQTDSNGNYYFEDFTLRGKIHADDDGMYFLDTIFPGKYSESGNFRPAHLHVKVSSPDGTPLTTQLYFADDEHHDWLVKPSLILNIDQRDGINYGEFDFVITP